MNELLKRKAWDLVRPIYAPITRRLRRRLARNYFGHPEMELPPPYESIQLDVERHLHQYLHVSPEAISQIVIVGAHEADEIHRLHRTYPRAHFLCFEPSPKPYRHLTQRFDKLPYVKLSNLALSNRQGTARFYEPGRPGNGSLLKPDIERWSTFNREEADNVSSFEVNLSTLDEASKGLAEIDLLWMDVQGAEGNILEGAARTLPRTKAVFLEVALIRSPYQGAVLFPEITRILQASGFMCVGLGVDGWNGAGNALFVKQFENLVCT